MLSSQQFDRARQLALSLAGIELVERHRELLGRRSFRLGIREPADLDTLLSLAEQGDATATQKLLCLLTTKFTGFFRHPAHFDLAAAHAFRVARQRGCARLWSAGAATGEEPYSLAIALLEGFQCDDPPARILATDVDAEALAAAQRGEYARTATQALSPGRRERFFCETDHARTSRVTPAVRRLVEFRMLNLVSGEWPVKSPFDVILCRNVLMYLETRHRAAVLERMASRLVPDGLLMLDPAEHLGQAEPLFTSGAAGVYSLRHASARPDARKATLTRTEL